MDSTPTKTLPALPNWELLIVFAVVIGHFSYAWYLVWEASVKLQKRLYDGFFETGRSILSYRQRDASNFEWNSYFGSLQREISSFIVHVIALRVLEKCISNNKVREAVLAILWIGILWYKLNWVGVLATFVQGAILLTLSRIWPWKPIIWLCACLFLSSLATDYYPLEDDEKRYRFAVYIAYKLLHFLSFCLCSMDAKRKGRVDEDDERKGSRRLPPYIPTWMDAYYAMMRYTLYPPYASTLIVTYPDFTKQWHQRHLVSVNYGQVLSYSIRIAFWSIFNEVLLHFVYNTAMIMDPYFLQEVDLPTLCAVGYTSGQFFQMKYVSIFGLNTIFALIDGMTPPKWPPICISRVALYSNMWRNFDRGLYAFLREHIFIPLASPSFSFLKRTLATFITFAFIWLWHGASMAFVYWVGLNFAEIMFENIAKEIYRLPGVHGFVNRKFRPVDIRRVRAIFHVPCTALGIFSIFYFLGGSMTGNVFVERLVFAKWFHFKPAFFYLCGLGYCFSHVCMEVEAWLI